MPHKCSTCGQAADDGAEFRYKSDGETPLKTCMRCLEKKSKAAASVADSSAFNDDYPRELLTVQHKIEDYGQRIGKLEGVAFDLDEGALPPAATMDTRGADFAEWFPKRDESEPIEAGDVVQLVDGHISRAFTSVRLTLVVSSRPFMVANMPREMEEQRRGCPCVLSGQAPVKAYGAVFASDALIPSGYGDGTMCAAPAAGGMVIAMETSEAPGIKRVLAMINAGERATLGGGKSLLSSKTSSVRSFSVFGSVVGDGISVFGSVYGDGMSVFGSVYGDGMSVFGSVRGGLTRSHNAGAA